MECNVLVYPTSDLVCGDSANIILGKILQRLKETAGGTVNIGDVSLTASDLEIGAVELKDGTTDTRAKIRTSDPDPSDPGLVVRNIPSGTQTVDGSVSVSNFPALQPVSDGGGSLTIDGSVAVSNFPATQVVSGSVSVTNFPAALSVTGGGVEAAALRVTIASDSTGVLSIDDNGGSLTIDGSVSVSNFPAALSVVGGGVEATALRVTIASDSTGVLSVDDNGGSLTIDGSVSVSNFPATVAVTQSTSPWVVSGSVTANAGTNLNTSLLALESGGNLATIAGKDFATQTTLAAMSAKLPATLGQKTMANSFAVVFASDQSAIPISGTITATPTGTQDVNLIQVAGSTTGIAGSGAIGAGTQRVVLATDQPVIPVSDNGSSLTVDGTVAATQSGTWNITNVSGTVSLPTGAATSANQSTEITSLQLIDDAITADDAARNKSMVIGAVFDDTSTTAITENQAGYVRMSSRRALLVEGVSGGIALAISAVSLPLPSGAATSALQTQPGVDIGDVTINNASGASAVNIQDGGNSITVDGTFFQATQPVSIAATVAVSGPLTDAQLRATAVPVSGTLALSGTVSTKTALTASAPTFHTAGTSSAVALAANANRKGLTMVNTSVSAISLAFGTAAVLYSGLTLLPGSAWTMDEFTFTTAEIRDIASAASSNLAIQEFV